VLLEAWIGQRTEWTKSVFAMSSAAVGLMVTALLNRDALALLPMTKAMLFLGGISFGIAASTCLSAFITSADAVEQAMLGRPLRAAEAELGRLEAWQRHGFLYGLGFLLLAALLEHSLRT
jgi:hypothetical protein